MTFRNTRFLLALVYLCAFTNAYSLVGNLTDAFSLPYYPSPNVSGTGDWNAAVTKAKALISTWTLEQKINVTAGIGYSGGVACSGNTLPLDTVGFPALCLQDGPAGVRGVDHTSGFPAGVHAVSTWDRNLIRARSLAIGEENKEKGIHVSLGPMMNIGRLAWAGRNFEGFSADSYLSGEAAFEAVTGMQAGGVIACAKHYIGNDQETNSTTESSNIDDKTLHEVYLHPFLRSVQAGVGSVMCSYNLINNSWACQNSKTLNGILKTELGFQGFVVSDWGGTHSTVGGALAGLDMNMPGGDFLGYDLYTAVKNGSVSESRADDMATRIVAAWYYLGQDEGYPATNYNSSATLHDPSNKQINVQANHKKIIREVGAAGIILLKNINGTLPLKSPRNIALIGLDVAAVDSNLQSGAGGSVFGGDGVSGTLAIGGGSGTVHFPYMVSPLEAIQAEAYKHGTDVTWWTDNADGISGANTTAIYSDVAMVFISAYSSEGEDRSNLTSGFNGDAMVQSVLGVNSNVIVVVNAVNAILMDSWINHPNLTAVVWAGLPGQETGNALVDILWGNVNPSGRLPFTIAKDASDYAVQPGQLKTSLPNPQVDYSEGVFVDYRQFLAQNITPRYIFGFGLSYTTFSYSSLAISEVSGVKEACEWYDGTGIGASVTPALHEARWNVTFKVCNTGNYDGNEVSQLYLKFPGSSEPPKVLRGFERTFIATGCCSTINIALSQYSLSEWSSVSQKWVVPAGAFEVIVGSSADVDHYGERLKGWITPS